MLWELTTNALKYTPVCGKIDLVTYQNQNHLVLKISDTGKGIPSETLPTLFEGFKKIDIFHVTQPGMGLGLYIVKRIVDLHEGQITVESKVGHGTTVTIILPIKNLSEIKPNQSPINIPVQKQIPQALIPDTYKMQNSETLPHPLQVIKCLLAFRFILAAFN